MGESASLRMWAVSRLVIPSSGKGLAHDCPWGGGNCVMFISHPETQVLNVCRMQRKGVTQKF